MIGSVTKFMNCFILRNHRIQKEDLYVKDGKILNPEPFFYDEKKSPHHVIDCKGCLIAPGDTYFAFCCCKATARDLSTNHFWYTVPT
jgi:hypothetical protein